METPKEYHYIYYSYEEYGRGYIGSRTCKCLPEEDVKYFGSFHDRTFNPTQKIILKSDYATRIDAIADEIILHDFYDVANNPHFANQAKQTSTKFFYICSCEEYSEKGKKSAQKQKELGIGLYGLTKKQRSENGKIFGRMGGLNAVEKHRKNGTGFYAFTSEQLSEYAKKSIEIQRKNGTGLFAITDEQRSETTRKTNFQKWMCLETGFITNAGNLSRYQMKRGIDKSKRIRIK